MTYPKQLKNGKAIIFDLLVKALSILVMLALSAMLILGFLKICNWYGDEYHARQRLYADAQHQIIVDHESENKAHWNKDE